VISVMQSTDHRVDPPVERFDATLNRFSPGGAWGKTQFPEHNGGGGTTASPNFWRFNGTELVIVPALYRRPVGGGYDVRLLAFSPGGAVVADQVAASVVPQAFGGSAVPTWMYPLCITPIIGQFGCYARSESEDFGSPKEPERILPPPPFPGVGIFVNPRGGTPWILVSDYFQDVIGFTFSDNSFLEAFRVHDGNRLMRSPPTILPDAHTIIGTQDIHEDGYDIPTESETGGTVFTGPNQSKIAPLTGLPAILAAPTLLPDGGVALVGNSRQMTVLSGGTVAAKVPLADYSHASAAASRTHLFVSTNSAFQTFDPNTLAEVAHVDWAGGGRSPPAIGPEGQVYAIAGNTLYIFPRPFTPSSAANTADPVVVGGHLEPTAPAADSHAYKPPLLADGNRLFACEKLDGDDCGKGDYGAIAIAFCQKMGFVGAGHIEVDSKKVKAETLDGQYCSKKKCKVFDQIICANN
jgi:hypothetical protein